VSIRARNAGGNGNYSASISITAPACAPSNVSATIVTTVSDRIIQFNLPVPVTNGALINLYQLNINATAIGQVWTIYSVTPAITSGLLPSATSFTLQWAARNSVGWSAFSIKTTVTTLVSAPQIVSYTASNPSNLGTSFAVGHVLTIVFNMDTSAPNSSSLLVFTPTMTSNFTAEWSNPRTLALTITEVGVAPIIGVSFVTLSADLYNAQQTSVSARGTSSTALTGNWGLGYPALKTISGYNNVSYLLYQDGSGASLIYMGAMIDLTLLGRSIQYQLQYTCTSGVRDSLISFLFLPVR
jgi:hypothetical protein